MALNHEQATSAAFTLLGQGQFQRIQLPQGIPGKEASFHQLQSSVFKDLLGTLVHIDRVILNSQNWEQHLESLTKAFGLLCHHQLHISLEGTWVGHQRSRGHGIPDQQRSYPDESGSVVQHSSMGNSD